MTHSLTVEKSQSRIIKTTGGLRWFMPNSLFGLHPVLQQEFIDLLTGETEWRDVERVIDESGDT